MANTFDDPFYILRFDRDYSAKLDGAKIADESVEEAFEVVTFVTFVNPPTSKTKDICLDGRNIVITFQSIPC